MTMTASAQKATGLHRELDSVFLSYFRADEPGGAVLIGTGDRVIYKNGFGVADLGTREPVTTRTLFNLGSISKTFVGFGILKLEEEGLLSLSDPLNRYFNFRHGEVVKDIRLHHLLTHTSGLPDIRKVQEKREFYITAKDAENWAPILETDSLHFQPGTRYKYSNPAFNALALIIEQLTRNKWQEYIRDKIFVPSGMQTSTITDGPHPEAGVSHGYILNGRGEFEELDYGEEPTFAAAGNGGVWSSVEELWAYEQAIRNNVFLAPSMVAQARSVRKPVNWQGGQDPIVGYSWFITRDSGIAVIGHTGSQGGFIGDYCWLPEKNVFYVLLCNIPRPIREIRSRVFDLLSRRNWKLD